MKWKRRTGWTLSILLILLLIAAISGYLFLKSSGFQRYALGKIVQAMQEATGARTEIGRLDFNLSTLTAHLYDITVHGTEPAGQPALLHVDQLTVALKIKSILHHAIYLDQLLIAHPVAHLQVNRSGKNNIPATPVTQSSSHTNVFDLAVRHLQLASGEIFYNDQQTPLDADLYDLRTDIHFDMLATRYSGSISYDNGHIRYGRHSPLAHSLNSAFSATRSHASLESAVLKIGSSVINIHADVPDYNDLSVNGDYDIRIHTQDFREIEIGRASCRERV